MKQDIFSEIGKRTPFRTPEGFFEQQEQTLKQAVSRQISVVRPLRRRWWYAIAACALLLIAVYPVMQFVHSSSDSLAPISDTTPVYSQTSSSSASDDWSDFADADMFLDNMNW